MCQETEIQPQETRPWNLSWGLDTESSWTIPSAASETPLLDWTEVWPVSPGKAWPPSCSEPWVTWHPALQRVFWRSSYFQSRVTGFHLLFSTLLNVALDWMKKQRFCETVLTLKMASVCGGRCAPMLLGSDTVFTLKPQAQSLQGFLLSYILTVNNVTVRRFSRVLPLSCQKYLVKSDRWLGEKKSLDHINKVCLKSSPLCTCNWIVNMET